MCGQNTKWQTLAHKNKINKICSWSKWRVSEAWVFPSQSFPPYYFATHPRSPLDSSSDVPFFLPPTFQSPWAQKGRDPSARTASVASNPPPHEARRCALRADHSPRVETTSTTGPRTNLPVHGGHGENITGYGSVADLPGTKNVKGRSEWQWSAYVFVMQTKDY